MRSICDGVCRSYTSIYWVVLVDEEKRRNGDFTKHLCSDCFVIHKKSEEDMRLQRREQRNRRFMANNRGGRPTWKAS